MLISYLFIIKLLCIFANIMKRQTSKEVQALKLRMAQLRVKFPFKDYTAVYQYEYGILSQKEKDRLYKTWVGLIADKDIIDNIERLIDNFK